MADQTQRLEIATVRAEVGSNIVFRFANDAANADSIPTQSGDIQNLKQVVLEIQQDAAEKISISTTIYPSVAAGLAATADQGIFLVQSNDVDEIYTVWQNQGGTAVNTGKTALSATAIQTALDASNQAANAAEEAADVATARTARYLAPSESEPTFRDNGLPLEIGDVWFNTVDQTDYRYTDQGWIANDSIEAISKLNKQITEHPVPNGIPRADASGSLDPSWIPDFLRKTALSNNADPEKGSSLVGYKGRTLTSKLEDLPDVRDYGAIGNGRYDDTDSINRALDDASSKSFRLNLSKGSYIYSGSGHPFSGKRLFLSGSGPEATQIILAPGSRLIDTETEKVAFEMSGFQVANGLGAFRSRFSGVDVSYQKLFENMVFIGYTACAIDLNAQDCPYWKIQNNTFRAANSSSTIGIALSRWADLSLLKGNAFLSNRVHLKMRSAGQCVNVESNDFIQFELGDGTPRISIWIVPGATNEGHGCNISSDNKFGLENLHPDDRRIVIAPELPGESNGTSMPDLSSDTSEFVYGPTITDNVFCGSDLASPSLLYSTTPNVRGTFIDFNKLQYKTPKHLLEFKTPPSTSEPTMFTNRLGGNNISITAGIASAPLVPTNAPGSCTYTDDVYANAGSPTNIYPHTSGANDRTGYVELFSSRASGYPLAGGATSQGRVTDATGETDAAALTLPNFAALNCTLPTAPITVGAPTWIEVDLRLAGATPLNSLLVRIIHSVGGNSIQRMVQPTSTWTRFRFPYKFRGKDLASTLQVINLSGATGTVEVGRVRVYHAREPITFGRAKFDQLNLSDLPTSPSGLAAGSLWVDVSAGGAVKRV